MTSFKIIFKELFMTKHGRSVILFIVCLIITVFAVVNHIKIIRYDPNGQYYYKCINNVRYLYSNQSKKSDLLMKDINDKPLFCN